MNDIQERITEELSKHYDADWTDDGGKWVEFLGCGETWKDEGAHREGLFEHQAERIVAILAEDPHKATDEARQLIRNTTVFELDQAKSEVIRGLDVAIRAIKEEEL